MKTLLRSLTMMILILALAGNNTGQVSAQTIPDDVQQIVTDLSLLEPYVHYVKVNGVQTQVLDTEAALATGFSNDVILLASEMVAYQNDLVVAASKKAHPPKRLFLKGFFTTEITESTEKNLKKASVDSVFSVVNALFFLNIRT